MRDGVIERGYFAERLLLCLTKINHPDEQAGLNFEYGVVCALSRVNKRIPEGEFTLPQLKEVSLILERENAKNGETSVHSGYAFVRDFIHNFIKEIESDYVNSVVLTEDFRKALKLKGLIIPEEMSCEGVCEGYGNAMDISEEKLRHVEYVTPEIIEEICSSIDDNNHYLRDEQSMGRASAIGCKSRGFGSEAHMQIILEAYGSARKHAIS